MAPDIRQVRREDRALLAGEGQFLADIKLADTLEVYFVRSERTHARIVGIDVSAAERLPGVVAVLTAADLPATDLVDELHPLVPGLAATPQPILARSEVRFVGESVAMVIAVDRYHAEDAAELVRIEYDDLAPATGVSSGTVIYDDTATYGDLSKAFAEASHVTTSRFDTSRCAAVPLETRGCIARHDTRSSRLTFWSSTQSEFVLRRRLADVTGLPESRIRVLVPDVGGGFGQKIPIHPEEAAVALAALHLGRCLRWVEDRRENLLGAPHAKQQTLNLRLATDEAGDFLALQADIAGDIGAYSFNSSSGLIEPYIAARYLPGPYLVQNYEYRVRALLTNKSPVAPYRGTGGTAAMAALEVLIEKHAQQVGLDPYELRRRNLSRQSDFPFVGVGGKQFDSGTHAEAAERMAEVIDIPDFRRRQEADRARGRYRGLGFCASIESTGRPLIARWKSSYDAARATLAMDGSVALHLGVSSQGQGHHSTLAQVAATALGVSPDDVTVLSGDTDAAPPSVYGTRASRTALMSGNAVHAATTELADRLLDLASEVTGVSKNELVLEDGAVAKSAGGVLITLAQLAERAYLDPELRRQGRLPELSVTRGFDGPLVFNNSCYGVEVEVDVGTGRARVVRAVAVEDCGRVLNPLVVDGQIRGAIIQGIGAALLEEFAYDDEGQILTSTLVDYTLPRSSDVPEIDVHHLCSESTTNPLGVKGVGESGSIATPAAIAAAVQDALSPFGIHVEALPLHPERILAMIGGVEPRPSGLQEVGQQQ